MRQSNLKVARIIYTRSGRGLLKDAQLIRELFNHAGWFVVLEEVSASHSIDRFTYYWERFKVRLPAPLSRFLDSCQVTLGRFRRGRVDLQIHLEIPFSTYLGACTANWLIPNQEWANMHQLQYLPYLSRILCKTQAAVEAYSPYNANVSYIGFSNMLATDLPILKSNSERFGRFLHVAGNNQKKGSASVIEAWRRNPDWPNLDFVVERPERFAPLPNNVTVWQSVSDQKLDALRSCSGVVLAPSEAEGFGHVILEAMAWGAVAVTTDAAPMNELVNKDRGRLVPWHKRVPCRLGYRYFVSVEALEVVINQLLLTPEVELLESAEKARAWVEENHRKFEVAFHEHLATYGQMAN